MYKNPSINPFHNAPQKNRALVQAASVEIEEERNEVNWQVNKKDKKQISSFIEGVGRIKSMDNVSRTCANMCGMIFTIIDVSKTKLLLYHLDAQQQRLYRALAFCFPGKISSVFPESRFFLSELH
jgi:hypothetical protein